MVLLEFSPSGILKDFIQLYRVVDFKFALQEVLPFKPYPPRPEQCLSFYPRDTETVSYNNSGKKIAGLTTVLMGQQIEVTNRYVGRDFLVFQVVFCPGALFRITGLPAYEITNAYLDAETVFSKEIKKVNEQLNEAKNYAAMIDVVESFLKFQVNKIKRPLHYIDQFTDTLLNPDKRITVNQFAKASFLSIRQLERKFKERLGVSPKFYNKVARFENAYRMKNKNPNIDWLTIAIHCGYHDYQHLVKDYKEFTLQTPTAFHLLDLASPERKFGEADTY